MTKTENSRLRSALKGASYIIFHETLFFLIAWVVVGDPYKAVTITLVGSLAEFVLYYFHERVWAKIKVTKKVEN
jgi:uncharacterized membrane protein